MSWTDDLKRAARAHELDDRVVADLRAFVEAFVRWNQKINLSSARTSEDVTLHVVDCMALLPYLPAGGRVVDVGSGGGLPAVVLAICRRDLAITSFEPIHKKAAFQSSMARELKLTLEVRPERVDAARDVGFDVAVSRATFDLPDWLALGKQLVRPGGLVLGMEGKEIHSLPSGASRHPYEHGDRTRAIVAYVP